MQRIYRAILRFKYQWELQGIERDLLAATRRDELAMTNNEYQSHLKFVQMLRDSRTITLGALEALKSVPQPHQGHQ